MSAAPIEVVDAIKHRSLYGYQYQYVLNRMPEFVYEKETINGRTYLIGSDGFMYKFYKKAVILLLLFATFSFLCFYGR